MADKIVANNKDHAENIVLILRKLIEYIKTESTELSSSKEVVQFIDTFNKNYKLIDQDKVVFNPEYDAKIGYEILKTYDAINKGDNFFSTILQVCDCNNLNLMEHLWSAIILVGTIVDKMDNDSDSLYFSYRDFHYYIFLNTGNDESNETLVLLKTLVKLLKYDGKIEFIPLQSDDGFDNSLYGYRWEHKLEKVDLLLLLDNSDLANLRHLKIVETLGLIQPLSFIISTSQNLTYANYVSCTPFQKNKLLKKSTLGNKHPGRWNLVYDSKCMKTGVYQGIDIEMTRCVEYLDG